jgi:hypothetical protein
MNRDPSTVDVHRPLCDGKPQPHTAALAGARLIDAKKAMKDAVAVLRRDPWTLVRDRKQSFLPDPIHAHRDRRGLRAVLDRVIEHVCDRLAKDKAIGRYIYATGEIEHELLVPLFG